MFFDEIGWQNGNDFWISGLARPGPNVQKSVAFFVVESRAANEPSRRWLSAVSRRHSARTRFVLRAVQSFGLDLGRDFILAV
jgi:hypothetical protein